MFSSRLIVNVCATAAPFKPSAVMTTVNFAVGGFAGAEQATLEATWKVNRSLAGFVAVAPEATVPYSAWSSGMRSTFVELEKICTLVLVKAVARLFLIVMSIVT